MQLLPFKSHMSPGPYQVADLAMPILSRPVDGISAEDVDLLNHDVVEDGGGFGAGDDEDGGDVDDAGLGPGAQVGLSW